MFFMLVLVQECRVVEWRRLCDRCGWIVRVVPATLVSVRGQNSNTGLDVVVELRREGEWEGEWEREA